MGYTHIGPLKKEKKMFIIGITIGALLSFLGSYIVATTFRIYDYGYSVDNILFLVIPLIVFVILLLMIPNIIKKLNLIKEVVHLEKNVGVFGRNHLNMLL